MVLLELFLRSEFMPYRALNCYRRSTGVRPYQSDVSQRDAVRRRGAVRCGMKGGFQPAKREALKVS